MEKRKLTRVTFNTRASINYNEKQIIGEVSDLSLNGMFLKTSDKIDQDVNINITIELTSSSSSLTIFTKGNVERISNNGIGIRFTEIDLDSFIHLRSIVEYNEGNPEKIMNEFFQFIKNKEKNIQGT